MFKVIVESHGNYSEKERDTNECSELVSYRYEECQHIRPNVKCPMAFSWAADNELESPCEQLVDFCNPICGHDSKGKCHEVKLICDWSPWTEDSIVKPKCSQYVYGHDEAKEAVLAYSVDEKDFNFKLKSPKGTTEQSFQCQVLFNVTRKCGHAFVTTCSKVYWQTYEPCTALVANQCPKTDCQYQSNIYCKENIAMQRSGKAFICKNKVEKLCQKCQINRFHIECSKQTIECESLVTVVLGCGHETSWVCGTDDDPRLNPASCQPCVYPKWEELIKSDGYSIDGNKVLMAQIITNIEKNVSEYSNELELTIFDEEKDSFLHHLNNHIECRPNIVRRYFENAKCTGATLSMPWTSSLIDMGFYEFVFTQVDNTHGLEKFEQKPTLYGKGYDLTVISDKALTKCKPNVKGYIHILIGAAFKFNACEFSSPFCASIDKKGTIISY